MIHVPRIRVEHCKLVKSKKEDRLRIMLLVMIEKVLCTHWKH